MSKHFPAKIPRWFFLPPFAAFLALLSIQLTGGEAQLFLWLNHGCQFAGDTFWISLTTFGDGLVIWIMVLPFVRRKPELVWTLLLSSLFVMLWVQGLKRSLNLPRPLAVLPDADFHIIGAAYQSKSFPSGHAASAAMFAAIVCLFYKQSWLRASIIILALLIALSRIAMGIHWATDVLTGFLGGWLSACLGYQLASRLRFGVSSIAQVIFGLSLCAGAIMMMVYNHTDYAQTFRLQQAIALASLACACYEIFFRSHQVNRDG